MADNLNTSFFERRLKIVIQLYKGEFEDGSNTKEITDLAMTCQIQKLALPEGGKASAEITGLPLSDMEQLTTLAFDPLYVKNNQITIYAGDWGGVSEVFSGTITKAGADFNASPDVKFKIEAAVGYFGRMTAQGPTAIHGSQDASAFIKGQCEKAGFKFVNQGVSAKISDCVFQGSPIQQAQACASQIGAELILDDGSAVLMQSGAGREGNTVVLSSTTGLLGYPAITQNGVECKAIFNPDFRFGGLIQLDTVVPKASGVWKIVKLTHKLSANMPGDGSWESQITGYYLNKDPGKNGKYS